jgi:hypothetical protein
VHDTAEVLELSDTESEVLPHLGRGVALWHVGEHARLVRHLVPAALLGALDSDAAMLGHAVATAWAEAQ